MPPATTTCASPSRTVFVPKTTACRPEPAHLTHCGRRYGVRNPAKKRGLTRGRLANAGGQHVAHEQLADVFGRQPSAFDSGADGCGTQTRRGQAGKHAQYEPIGVRAAPTI